MATLKNERNESTVQFLDTAREIKQFTREQCLKLPKRFTFFGGQETYVSASKVLEKIKKGNSVFPTNKIEYQIRRNYFLEAYAELNNLLECVAEIRGMYPVKDTVMLKWIEMIKTELKLVKALLIKDKERFSRLLSQNDEK